MILLLMLAVATLLPADPATSLLKCRNPLIPGHVTVVDDVVVQDSRSTGKPPGQIADLRQEDVIWVEVRCLRVRSDETADGWALRSAVVILTKRGAPKVMERQLAELVAEQRTYRARTGRYATSLAELAFLDSRTDIGIKLTVNGDSWSASTAVKGGDSSCRVADGADAGQPTGVPLCIPIGQPGQAPPQPGSR